MVLTSTMVWVLAAALLGAGDGVAALPYDAAIVQIRDRTFEIRFETPQPEAVTACEVWYTYDCAKTWQRFEPATSRQPGSVLFTAPREGLCGVYLILANPAGPSSPPPSPGTPPHRWCFVDWTPPLLQLQVADKDVTFRQTRRIALKWTVHDAQLRTRPIDVYYKAQGQPTWMPVELQLPNTGRFDWSVPVDVSGAITLKVTATDRGGNVAERTSTPIQIGSAPPVSEETATDSNPRQAAANHTLVNRPLTVPSVQTPEDQGRTSADAIAASKKQSPSSRPTAIAGAMAFADPTAIAGGRSQAARLYQAGTYYRLRGLHGQRGELALAVLRFQEALRADPNLAAARLDLAGVFVLQGKPEEAVRMYEALLERSPKHREALRGLALAMVRRGQYDEAKHRLQQLITYYPKDGEGWLSLGDLHHQTGDLDLARCYWTQAAGLKSADPDVATRARRRLDSLTRLPLSRP
jgi:TolA-binding protein